MARAAGEWLHLLHPMGLDTQAGVRPEPIHTSAADSCGHQHPRSLRCSLLGQGAHLHPQH